MSTPTDRTYAPSHEWSLLEGDVLTMGISAFAVGQLTDLTYIDLPEVGDTVVKGESFGEIESVKATSDLYASAGGEVIEVNPELADDQNLELLTGSPWDRGWMIKVRVTDASDLEGLMDAAAYDAYAKAESGDH